MNVSKINVYIKNVNVWFLFKLNGGFNMQSLGDSSIPTGNTLPPSAIENRDSELNQVKAKVNQTTGEVALKTLQVQAEVGNKETTRGDRELEGELKASPLQSATAAAGGSASKEVGAKAAGLTREQIIERWKGRMQEFFLSEAKVSSLSDLTIPIFPGWENNIPSIGVFAERGDYKQCEAGDVKLGRLASIPRTKENTVGMCVGREIVRQADQKSEELMLKYVFITGTPGERGFAKANINADEVKWIERNPVRLK